MGDHWSEDRVIYKYSRNLMPARECLTKISKWMWSSNRSRNTKVTKPRGKKSRDKTCQLLPNGTSRSGVLAVGQCDDHGSRQTTCMIAPHCPSCSSCKFDIETCVCHSHQGTQLHNTTDHTKPGVYTHTTFPSVVKVKSCYISAPREVAD